MVTRTDSIDGAPAVKHAFLPELALLTTIVLWASTFVVTKDAFTHIEVMAFVFIRFLLMTTMAFCILAVIRACHPDAVVTPQRSDLARFLGAGLAGFSVYQLGFNFGLDRTSVFSAALLISTSPLFTILFLTLIGERTPAVAWLGIAIAVAGVAIFLMDKRGGERTTSGDLLCLLAAASAAVYVIVNRPLVARYPPTTYTAWTLLFGAIPLLLIGIPSARDQDWGALTTRSWVAVIYMVIFPVYIAYMLWNFGIAHRGAIATSFVLLVPVLSGILAVLIYDEPLGATKLLGAGLVLGGLLLIRLGPRWLNRPPLAPVAKQT